MATGKRPKKAKKKSEWTASRLHQFIVGVLRSGTRRYPPKYQVLDDAKTTRRINQKTRRLAQHYLCAGCGVEWPASEVAVDHIEPVVSVEGFIDWDTFINKLYCEKDNLQVLCKGCHSLKTKEEGKARRANRTTGS